MKTVIEKLGKDLKCGDEYWNSSFGKWICINSDDIHYSHYKNKDLYLVRLLSEDKEVKSASDWLKEKQYHDNVEVINYQSEVCNETLSDLLTEFAQSQKGGEKEIDEGMLTEIIFRNLNTVESHADEARIIAKAIINHLKKQ